MAAWWYYKQLKVSLASMYSRRLSRPGSDGCCEFFGLLGRVLKIVLPDISPVSVAGIFSPQSGGHCVLIPSHSFLSLCFCPMYVALRWAKFKRGCSAAPDAKVATYGWTAGLVVRVFRSGFPIWKQFRIKGWWFHFTSECKCPSCWHAFSWPFVYFQNTSCDQDSRACAGILCTEEVSRMKRRDVHKPKNQLGGLLKKSLVHWFRSMKVCPNWQSWTDSDQWTFFCDIANFLVHFKSSESSWFVANQETPQTIFLVVHAYF